MACEREDLTSKILHVSKRGLLVQTQQHWAGHAMFRALYPPRARQTYQNVVIP